MKNLQVFLIFIVALAVSTASAQRAPSELRIKIDSIIQHQLHYAVDSDSLALPSHHRNLQEKGALAPSFSTFPMNPIPLILWNGKVVRVDFLDKKRLRRVAHIEVVPPQDQMGIGIFGQRAANGMIIISLKGKSNFTLPSI